MMKRSPNKLVLAVIIASLVCLGCARGTSAYVPTAATARKMLTTALEAWKSGAAHGPITSSKPGITVFDARWQAGAKLDSYEILEEIKDGEHPQFKVRMQLAGQPEETLTYRVVGIDPILVFRDADYKKATGQ